MDCATVREWFPRPARRPLAAAVLLVVVLSTSAAGPESWKFDVLRLKSGGIMTGILLDEDGDSLRFQVIRQRPGEKTRVTTTAKIQRDEVAKFDRLTDKDRDILRKRLGALDPNGKGERSRMEDVALNAGVWVQKDQPALCYSSEHFLLTSNADEEVVRRAALQLDDIYAAYARFLPARQKKGTPTKIILVRSMKEYQDLIKGQGRNILNPAFFDSARNEIVCASDLEELGDGLAKVKARHAGVLDRLKLQEIALVRQFGTPKQVPPALMRPIRVNRQEIKDANNKNEAIFQLATQQLFQTLYHEAFHAYLHNFVYPPQGAEVPRWLNEGLAQIFETAILEAGELRVGHADKERLEAIQAAVRKKQLIPLANLLKSGPNQFLVADSAAKQAADQHYLNSWALAYYLTFDRRILGTPALDRYVQSLKRGTNELDAFRLLVNKPLPQFEKDYHDYLLGLRADGTVRKKLR